MHESYHVEYLLHTYGKLCMQFYTKAALRTGGDPPLRGRNFCVSFAINMQQSPYMLRLRHIKTIIPLSICYVSVNNSKYTIYGNSSFVFMPDLVSLFLFRLCAFAFRHVGMWKCSGRMSP